MVLYKRSCPLFAVFLILWAIAPLAIQAQDDLSYVGPLRVGDYYGEASYNYRLVDKDTVLHGPFLMQQANLDALLTKQDTTFTFKGNFDNGYPDGNWHFQFGRFQADSLAEIVGLQYQLKVSGVQNEAVGKIKKGKPHGRWTITTKSIQASEEYETLFRSVIEFDSGTPQKSIRLESTRAYLVGRFLRNGLAHDEWTMYPENENDTRESWFFTNGRLEKIQTVKEGISEETHIYPKAFTNPGIIDLDKKYFQIIQLNRQLPDSSKVIDGDFATLLTKNSANYKKIDTILSGLGKSAFFPEFRVKVERYPLDSLKIQQLDSISTMYRESAAASRSLLENTHLNILKLSDEEVLQQYNLLKRYSEKFLIPLGKMTTYHQAGIWEYMDHKKLMAQIWPGGFPLESLSEDIAGQENLSEVRIASALQLAEIVVSEIRELQRALSAKLISEKQQQEFIAVENQLISQINQLNQLLDSVGADFPRKNLDALENIKSLAEANLSTYSATTELDIKLDLGRKLVVCFGHLAALEKAILALPGKQQEIETAYEDQIWNPFMANLMTERVKKRITGAYNKVLLPYFLKRATLDLNCENAGEQVDLIARTHQRMLELRDEDTRKLERKLRREQDPETIINLFGRSSNTPEN